MSGTILTPGAIWRGFETTEIPKAKVIEKSKVGSVNFTRLEIEGRTLEDGTVKIFALLANGKAPSPSPAILLIHELEGEGDLALQEELAKKGYTVLSVDVAGKQEGKPFYTSYPESISYANYENVKDSLFRIEGDVNHTCWYEWTAVARYALSYLKSLEGVEKVGCLGIGLASTILWQVAGTDDRLDCVCFTLNAGWKGYEGIYKFSGTVEPQFSDNMYKFIAGVEPQAYAMHVKCPVLMLCASNSNDYDCDRAYDTVSRIDGGVYKAVHYSVGYRTRVNGEAYGNILLFFENFLKNNEVKPYLPEEMDIKCELEDGKIVVEVSPDLKEMKGIELFVAEETVKPSLRAWRKLTDYTSSGDGKLKFSYSPYPQSNLVMCFAQARYKSGFVIGSNVVARKFNPEEVNIGYKSNIIYSSRNSNAESIFNANHQFKQDNNHINIEDKKRVKIKKGPMGIDGVYCKWGLMTFKINASVDKPNPDALLMFDVFVKESAQVTVKLICDYFGNPTEYSSTVSLEGGDIWHNIKIQRNKFKSEEGMTLKDYDKVNVIMFDVSKEEYLINNALWV